MFYSTRSKLLAGFLGVTLLVGAVSLFIGVHLIDQNVFGEALNRVQQDLSAAYEMYQTRIKQVKTSLSITTLGFAFISSVSERNTADLVIRLERMGRLAELDFAGIVTADGRTLCRMGPYSFPGPASRGMNPLAKVVLEQRVAVSGTMLLDREALIGENPDLAERARISLAPRRKSPREWSLQPRCRYLTATLWSGYSTAASCSTAAKHWWIRCGKPFFRASPIRGAVSVLRRSF
jgi:hypothetical protein